MTIGTVISAITVQGDGVTTAFVYPFVMPVAADAVVIFTDAAGAQSTLLSSQYAISGIGVKTGGTVIYPLAGSPIASGTLLTIRRVVPLVQTMSITNQGPTFSAIETEDDYQVLIDQQQQFLLDRTLQLNVSDLAPMPQLPPAVVRAGQWLYFDPDGNPTVASLIDGSVPVAAAWQPVIGSATTQAGLALISYLAAQTSAVLRLLVEKLGDIVSVKDFGAIGDGVTDDTSALQLAATNAGAIELYWPAGTYLVSSTLTMTTSGQSWMGDGPAATYIKTTAAFVTGDVVVFGDGTNQLTRTGISQLAVDAAVDRSSGAAVRLRGTVQFQSSGLTIGPGTTMQYDGISLEGSSTAPCFDPSFHDLEIRICANRGMRVGDVGNGSGYSIGDLHIDGALITACHGGGILLANCSAFYLSGIDVLANTPFAIIFDPDLARNQNVTFGFCTNITCDSTSAGSGWVFAGTGIVANISLTNCWGSSCTEHGFVFAGAKMSAITLVNCTAIANQQHGYEMLGAGNIMFDSCVAGNNSVSSVGTYHGWNIEPNVGAFQISNCLSGNVGFESAAGATNNQGYGFAVQAGTSDDYNIIGNRAPGNITGGFFDAGTGVSKNVTLNITG